MERLAPSLDGGDDFVWVCGPDKGAWVLVGLVDEAIDGGLRIDNEVDHAALEAAVCQFGEEPPHRVEPGRRGWRLMKHEGWMARQPAPYLGVLVGCLPGSKMTLHREEF